MLIFISFWISIIIGYLLIELIIDDDDYFLKFFLATGLGLGISALLLFLILIITNQLTLLSTFLLHFLLLSFLLILYFFQKNGFLPNLKSFYSRIKEYWPLLLVLFIQFLILSIYIIDRPLGSWDAWSSWNLKAKFLFYAPERYTDIFQLTRSAPDYPLLLSLNVVWGWLGAGKENLASPMALAIIYSVSVIGLLIVGLNKFIDFRKSLLAGIFLISAPFFLAHSTSQYADIVIAYYLLASVTCFLLAFRNLDNRFFLLGGIFTGLGTFTKNEGILYFFLIFLFLFLYSIFKKSRFLDKFREFSYALVGAFPFLSVAFIWKFLAPINYTFNSNNLSAIVDINKRNLFFIIHAFILQFFNFRIWSFFWLIFIITFFIFLIKRMQNKNNIFIFFILSLSLIGFLIAYAIAGFSLEESSLGQLIKDSINRLFLQLSPLIVLFVFFVFFRITNKSS